MKTTSILVLAATAMVGFGALPADAVGQESQSPPPKSPEAPAVFAAQPAGFAFGDVSISGGSVTTRFEVTNVSDRPVRLQRVYTSCNCTTVALKFSDGTEAGRFGMQGHEFLTEYDRVVQPGESFEVQAFFAPATHGLDGLGDVTRIVRLEPADDPPLDFTFTATVVQP